MYTKSDIKEHLAALGAPKNKPVIVHTAYRIVGEVEGGAEGLLSALIEYFTEDGGLLCIPTHTWANLGKDKITLDLMSPESNLGAIPNLAAELAKVGVGIRSENPTHSMVVFGDRKRAADFIKDDARVTTPTSGDSCYGKIYNEDGYVLLLGVSQNKNTFLHTVDEMLGIKNRMSDKPILTTVRRENGELIERKLYLYDADFTDDISWRFQKMDTAFRYRGCVRSGFVGDAPTDLCSARGMLDTMKIIYERYDGDPFASEKPIPPKCYSK